MKTACETNDSESVHCEHIVRNYTICYWKFLPDITTLEKKNHFLFRPMIISLVRPIYLSRTHTVSVLLHSRKTFSWNFTLSTIRRHKTFHLLNHVTDIVIALVIASFFDEVHINYFDVIITSLCSFFFLSCYKIYSHSIFFNGG